MSSTIAQLALLSWPVVVWIFYSRMGPGRALLMRGNGAVVWGESIEAATVLAWYLEDMCRIELVALQAGLADSAPVIAPAEAEARATRTGRIIERMWDHLVAGDPELNPQ